MKMGNGTSYDTKQEQLQSRNSESRGDIFRDGNLGVFAGGSSRFRCWPIERRNAGGPPNGVRSALFLVRLRSAGVHRVGRVHGCAGNQRKRQSTGAAKVNVAMALCASRAIVGKGLERLLAKWEN